MWPSRQTHRKKPGKQIKTFEELFAAVDERRAVVSTAFGPWRDPRPAAVIVHHQATLVKRLIDSGLYIYGPDQIEKKGNQND